MSAKRRPYYVTDRILLLLRQHCGTWFTMKGIRDRIPGDPDRGAVQKALSRLILEGRIIQEKCNGCLVSIYSASIP
jgi:hypothetical protein